MAKLSRRQKQLLLCISTAILFFLGVWLYQKWEAAKEAERLSSLNSGLPSAWTLEIDGKQYGIRPGIETCLVIGIDKESDRLEHLDAEARLNNLQSDFLLLLIGDRKAETVTALHINRDTMAEIPRLSKEGLSLSPVTEQLALSHTYGTGGRDSCLNTLHAVSGLLFDLPIDHYFSLTMDAVPVLADLAGGVPVQVEDDFSKVSADLPQGETVTLHGDLALTFFRARHGVGDSSNLNRMARQRVFLNSLYGRLQAKLAENSSFALTFADALSPYVISDLITDEIAELMQNGKTYTFSGVEAIPGRNILGEKYMEFYPNEKELKEQLIRLILQAVE